MWQIDSCRNTSKAAAEHEKMGFLASASVQLTLALVHIADAIKSYPNHGE